MNDTRLYGVLGSHGEHGQPDYRIITYFCMATDPDDALAQQQDEECAELGGPVYGRADAGDAHEYTMRELDSYRGPMAPEGTWYATDEALEALAEWRKQQDTWTLSMFGEAADGN